MPVSWVFVYLEHYLAVSSIEVFIVIALLFLLYVTFLPLIKLQCINLVCGGELSRSTKSCCHWVNYDDTVVIL